EPRKVSLGPDEVPVLERSIFEVMKAAVIADNGRLDLAEVVLVELKETAQNAHLRRRDRFERNHGCGRAAQGIMTGWIHHTTQRIPCLFHPRSCVPSSMLGSATQRPPLDLPGRHPIVEFRRMIGMANAGPLKGIKVVEMGIWVAGPAAAAVL